MVAISLYQRDMGRGLGIRACGKFPLFLCVLGSVGVPVYPEPPSAIALLIFLERKLCASLRMAAPGREWEWLGCGASMVQHVLRVCEAIGSIPNSMGQEKGRRRTTRHANMCLILALQKLGQEEQGSKPSLATWQVQGQPGL